MDHQIAYLERMMDAAGGCWHERITAELLFCAKFSRDLAGGKYDGEISAATDKLRKSYEKNGAVTKDAALSIEGNLKSVSAAVKEYKIIFTSHAHIDMNWMWAEAETVAVTVDTFRTVLNLMDEYKDFTYSQSQASVYAFVEKYYPEMFEKIRKRVSEGRWEVTASTWVETDKNMPNGESLTRHVLYTKQYFEDKFGMGPDELELDFEPDTFGHNLNVPEIITKAGVKYYYHCRGYNGHVLYRYKSPSGAETLVYREPEWYNAAIDHRFLPLKADFFKETGVKTGLKVYGVGDHGGGPTRRDIEKIIAMKEWPLIPAVEFGTYRQFFKAVEPQRESFPVVDKELNFIFDGCYTTQTRIKAANRIGENRLGQAELINALARAYGISEGFGPDYFREGWKKILFNHFHDIITGSGVQDTREAALGAFQDTLSRTNTSMTDNFIKIASKINTSGLAPCEDVSSTVSEGAGVGYSVMDFAFPATERGKGKGRVYHVFNNSGCDRKCVAKTLVWDWPGNAKKMRITDAGGKSLRFTPEKGKGNYWGHEYLTVYVEIDVPMFGYNTFVLNESPAETASSYPDDPRTLHQYSYELENGFVKAAFDPVDMDVICFTDAKTGKCLVKNAGLRFVYEDPTLGMSSWTVGRYNGIKKLTDVKILDAETGRHSVRKWIRYSAKADSSVFTVTVSLDDASNYLEYHVKADFFERGSDERLTQLQFSAETGYEPCGYLNDIPFGVIERSDHNHDVPGQSFICAKNKEGASAGICARTKYGFRGNGGVISVDLIRASTEPDPYPEIGIHNIEFMLFCACASKNEGLLKQSAGYNTPPVVISGGVHDGGMPVMQSLLTSSAGAVISAVKNPECGCANKLIVRVYEPDGNDAAVALKFNAPVKAASFTDALEVPKQGDVKVSGNSAEFALKAFASESVLIEF